VAKRVTLEALRRTLARLDPPRGSVAPPGQTAAVAAVVREREREVEILFIRRAEHPRDPWSGDMGWPGGRVDPDDASPLAAAVRETREELSLDLERDATPLGALPPVRTHLRHGPGPLWVAPFVFEVHTTPQLKPNAEVQEALWVPLAFLADRVNRGTFIWTGFGVPRPMPCYRYDGRVIWGLTLRMLDDLLALLA
jgi:8-oxo-dGTP pyrophosphatase MutT (NUDIX family)